MENSHGNSAKPPSSATTEGTAVAMTVASMATSAVDSMMPIRTGPRSDRKPTSTDAAARSTLTGQTVDRLGERWASDPSLRPVRRASGAERRPAGQADATALPLREPAPDAEPLVA